MWVCSYLITVTLYFSGHTTCSGITLCNVLLEAYDGTLPRCVDTAGCTHEMASIICALRNLLAFSQQAKTTAIQCKQIIVVNSCINLILDNNYNQFWVVVFCLFCVPIGVVTMLIPIEQFFTSYLLVQIVESILLFNKTSGNKHLLLVQLVMFAEIVTVLQNSLSILFLCDQLKIQLNCFYNASCLFKVFKYYWKTLSEVVYFDYWHHSNGSMNPASIHDEQCLYNPTTGVDQSRQAMVIQCRLATYNIQFMVNRFLCVCLM